MHKLLNLILLLPSLTMAASPNRAADYAFEAQLEENDHSLQRIVLSAEIMQNITQRDASDIAVFNIDGKMLPLGVFPTPANKIPHQLELPFHEFDQFMKQHSRTVTRREQNQSGESLSELSTTETVAVQSVSKTYLIELQPDDKSRKFQRIALDWRHQPESQVLRVKVEAGQELDRLSVLASNKSLTNRKSDDFRWRSIRGVSANYKYMRITPITDVESFELLRVDGHYEETTPPAKVSIRIQPEASIEDGEIFYSFVNPSAIFPEAMRIIPAEPNTIIRGDLYLKWINDDKRLPIKNQFQQHNIDDDQVEPSRLLELPRNFWEKVWFRSNTELAQTPRVELIYPQYEVAFLGDGNKPYRLAWGNHDVSVPPPGLKGLVSTADWNNAQMAGLLAIEEAGGVSRLAAQPVLPWKKYLLWALLVFAAIVTGRMAVKLYREMNHPDSV